MKHAKLLILLIMVPVSAGLILATAYFNSANNSHHEAMPSHSPQSTASPSTIYELQILSPENITYRTTKIQLNATVNGTSGSKITYTLDGEENVTLTENAEIRGLSDGMHTITFYAFDNSSKLEAVKTVTFSVKHQTHTPKPPETRAEAIAYFESQGFTIQKVENITIDGYYDEGPPRIRNSIGVGLENVAYYAHVLNTTVISEFEADAHWGIFFVESGVTGCKFYSYVYD